MAKQTGLGDNLYVGGRDLSGDIGALGGIAGGPAALEVTGIDKSAKERLGGARDGSLDFTAFFNDAAGQAHPTLGALPTADAVVSYLRGTALGAQAACLVGKQIGYDGNRNDDGSLTFKVNALANGFGLEWGRLLTQGKRTDSGPNSSVPSLDHGAETTFGLQAYLHVFAFTGTSATVTVRGASDSGFTTGLQDQATFTVDSAPQAQRVAGLTSTVRQFLKVNTSGTFTSMTFVVVVVRNDTTVVF